MKLNQVLAISKNVKSRTNDAITDVNKKVEKGELFRGNTRNYTPIDDLQEALPPESKLPLFTTAELLGVLRSSWEEQMDAVRLQDEGNMHARADVVVEGTVVLKAVPATHLMYLIKQLTDLQTILQKWPVLDQAEQSWTWVAGSYWWKSAETATIRTKKLPKVLVKYEATEKHPAQTEVYHDDIQVGTWRSVKVDAGMEKAQKNLLTRRCHLLLEACKKALEEANAVEVQPPASRAAELFDFLFARQKA